MEPTSKELAKAGQKLGAWLRRNRATYRTNKVFAEALGRSESWISAAIAGALVVPAELAVQIQALTGEEVPASLLRPDLWRRRRDVPAERVRRRAC